jgi:hypothetical protein
MRLAELKESHSVLHSLLSEAYLVLGAVKDPKATRAAELVSSALSITDSIVRTSHEDLIPRAQGWRK